MFEVILQLTTSLITGLILIAIGIYVGATTQKTIDEKEETLLTTAREKGYYLRKLDENDYFE